MSKPFFPTDKPKLTAVQQIEALKGKGIRFDLFPEDRAEEFLTHRNYFFKLHAFAKNFDKWVMPDGSPGQYMNLDFAYLVELSKLDADLRAFVLGASLDIEHFLKVRINEAVMADPACNGYEVVAEFLRYDDVRKVSNLTKRLTAESAAEAATSIAALADGILRVLDQAEERVVPESVVRTFDRMREVVDRAMSGMELHHVEKSISHLSTSTYSRKIAEKYGEVGSMAIWNLVELASFGDIISLYKFFFIERVPRRDETAQKVKQLLFPAKTLRNAAAHNSCLLNGMRDRLSKPVGSIAKTLREEYDFEAEPVAYTKRVPLVHDLSALLICYDHVVAGSGIRRNRATEMRRLSSRLMLNSQYFEKQPEVSMALSFVSALLDRFGDLLDEDARHHGWDD